MPGIQSKATTNVMRIAKRQRRCFTASQARHVGIGPKSLASLTHGGLVTRVFRGVYVVGGAPSPEERMMAACLATHGRVSHWSAASLWGFGVEPDGPVHVLVAGRNGTRREQGIVVHRTRRSVIPATQAGIPVTTPARTLVDVASLAATGADDDEVVVLVGHFVARRLVTLAHLEDSLSREAAGVPGAGRLRSLIAEMAGPVESVAELELVNLVLIAGLPKPITQFEARTADGELLGRLDAAYPAQRIAIEVDGYRFHADYDSFVADRERHNRLVASGWTVLRATPAAIRSNPSKLLADIRTALACRKAA